MDTERTGSHVPQTITAAEAQQLQPFRVTEGEVWCAACQRMHQQQQLHWELVGTTIEGRCPATGVLLLEV